jgi:hypothetical protein
MVGQKQGVGKKWHVRSTKRHVWFRAKCEVPFYVDVRVWPGA